MRWLDATCARLRLLVSRRDAESRMNQEFRLHIDLETEKLMRETGLAPNEARRRAMAAFGGVEKHKEALRDNRGLAWLGGFALDLKLAARLLVKYPGLTLVATAAMAFGIAAGVGAFEVRTQLVTPSLPLDQGSRIVGLRNWDTSGNRSVLPAAYDFATWREELTLVEDVGAASVFHRNLLTNDGRSEAVAVAAMSGSAFRLARVAPLFGRTLVEADEQPGSPMVIVIGHEIWRERFAGDPAVLGRMVRLGNEETTVVGVMPEGFAFPAAHAAWVPLRIDNVVSASTEGLTLLVFGRLAKDASKEQAQSELNAIGLRMAAGSPETREHLRPQIVPYTRLFFDPENVRIGVNLGNAFVVMLLVLVSANVALLMFARAASRENEIAVRSALGAGRARIVTQLFLEALVLAGLAVGVGLAAARFGLRSALATREADLGQPLPFWVGDSLTPGTVVYAAGLALLSAAVIGILPALKVTGRRQDGRLRQSTAGGGGFRFGGMWTAVIASQIAVTLMFPAAAFVFHRWVVDGQTREVGFPANQYLSTRLEFERGSAPGMPPNATEQEFRSRIRGTYAELERRVIAEPEAAGVTFADPLPGTLHPRWRIDVDGEAAPSTSVHLPDVRSASVALNFFDVLGAPVLSGRNFAAADLGSSRGVVIVNQSFVNHVLGGQNPIGRRVRRRPLEGSEPPGPWLEIVGVVKDLGMVGGDGAGAAAGLYQPVSPERASTLWLAIRVKGNPESFAARLRTVAGEIDPTLQIHELMPLDAVGASGWLESQYMSRVLAVLSAIALLLSLTAIYSVMAFTVVKRTREIGIRLALGADRRRVIGVILRRPLAQVSLGIVLGGILVAVTYAGLYQSTPTATEAVIIAAYSMLMMGVCLLACVVPARRALRVEPADVLKIDG